MLFTRRHALRFLGASAGVSLLAARAQPSQPAPPPAPAATTPPPPAPATQAPPAATQAPPAAKPAATQAPAQAAQPVNLRWFFWTGSEEEVKFWTDLAAQASKALG